MTRDYGESKYVSNYLSARYGEIYELNFKDQKELRESIILDHDKSELKRMLRRSESQIKRAKDIQPLHNIVFNFITVLLPVLTTVIIGMITVTFTMFNTLLKNHLGEEKISKDELFEWLKSLDPSPVFQLSLYMILIAFVILGVFYILYVRNREKNMDRRYYLSDLLKDCIIEYNKISNENRRI
ncbi:hypothetical protein NST15_03480 [Bacillus sp. FSL R5-0820]|uniref:hypothetical protein n=1 Tax=Bacillus TaxID=1386 RepID=UPI000361969C|nr:MULTISPECIES: hypothetical protein [Bacillus]MBW3702084.1 hypothetical protein [Bacillus aerophilus]MCA0117871.1 hypothetical protein [Bacillus sp. RSS_NA_20]MCL6797141.1 hypothetical protein [Bacillus altitudinis]MCL7873711.1 hypothetical protein [Bacillus altitudinis]MCY7530954.1 hypothetical protein [Bacillus altitudinis]